MSGLPEMLTVKEVAKALRRSPHHVRKELIGKGRLRAVRLTSKANWLIPVEAVEALLGRKVVEPEMASAAVLRRTRLALEEIRARYMKPRGKRARSS